MSDSELLVVDGLTRRFGGLVAVNGMNMTIGAGECVGLIGPNGAGKTTFFNGISGFDRRRGDRVTFAAENVSRLSPSARAKRGLIRTFQGARVFKALTVEQHLWITEHALPGRDDERRRNGLAVGRRLVADLGLLDHAGRRAEDLPYGLMKVLGIVMSVSAGARLLMLDEPVAGLGEDEGRYVEDAVRQVREGGVAVLVIEHHLEFISQIVDRLVVMNFGQEIANGQPVQVLSDPLVRDAYVGS